METHRYLWLAMAGLGFAAGFAIPRESPDGGTPPAEAAIAAGAKGDGASPVAVAPVFAPAAALPVSTDTIADLLVLNDSDLYARLGLWLLDASEEQMAEFWSSYHARGKTDMWIKDLVFTQWAKLNPQSLLAAAKRDGEEGPAWWAWTMSDPDAALAAGEGLPDDMRGYLVRGLGNFHTERALKMLEESPELARMFDLGDLAKELGEDDPEAGVEFMSKYPNYSLDQPFRHWVEEDPHEAFRWLKERGQDRSLEDVFFNVTARENPDAFAELAASLPAGSLKRRLENAAFTQLAAKDPEEALELARAAEAPRTAADRYAELGKSLIAEKPERAMEILGELLGKFPDAPYRSTWIRYPGGATGSGRGSPAVSEFLSELAASNPRLTMESVIGFEAAETDKPPADPFRDDSTASRQVATFWAERDPEEFGRWCEGQDAKTLGMGAAVLSDQLRNQKDYEGAVAWGIRISEASGQANALGQTLSQWARADPEAAMQWFEQAPLTAQTRQRLQGYLPHEADP